MTSDAGSTPFLELAASGSTRPAIKLALDRLAAGETADRLILDLLAPTQQHVGALWERNEWTVSAEHVATAVVDGVLGAVSLQTDVPGPSRGTVLAACVEGEYHTLPARMGLERLRSAGWETMFLGGSLGPQDLQRHAAAACPDIVVLCCTVPLFLAGAGRCISAMADLGLPVVAAGAGFGETSTRADRLGASAWIGPGDDPSLTLERILEPARSPPEPHPEAIALELQNESLREQCLAELWLRIPAMSTYSPAHVTHAQSDVGLILGYLGVALDMDEPELFETFVSWLTGFLGNRGLPASVVETSLEVIAGVLARAELFAAAAICAPERRAAPLRPA